MHNLVTAIVPIIVVLLLGGVLNRRFVTDPRFWTGLEWTSYRVFTPALFVGSIARSPLGDIAAGPLVISLVVPVVAVSAVLFAVRRVVRASGPQLTSLVQGSIRQNTYIGLVFASALHGTTGIAAFALAAAVMVPLVNVISILALSVHGRRDTETPTPSVLRQLVTNPLIVACMLGLLLNVTGIGLPDAVAGPVDMLAEPALVTGTLVVGAAVSLRLRVRDSLYIALTSTLKLLVLPLSVAALAGALGMSSAALAAVVLICAVPTAPSAYILAAQMGGDSRLMASITGVQTILCIGTLPFILHLTLHA